ncbi:uncharacterized protein LOC141909236 [Tubulanus polymorphus]|uniref:uncharacterized protein LOC141909236 n=1 Tax=Tubulanus polymorphus TaxID=672921 RepID=UPI003DA6C7FF
MILHFIGVEEILLQLGPELHMMVGPYAPVAIAAAQFRNIPYFIITPMEDTRAEIRRMKNDSEFHAGMIINLQPLSIQAIDRALVEYTRAFKSRRVLILADTEHFHEITNFIEDLLNLSNIDTVVQAIMYNNIIKVNNYKNHKTTGMFMVQKIYTFLVEKQIDTVVFFFTRWRLNIGRGKNHVSRWENIDKVIRYAESADATYTWLCGSMIATTPSMGLLNGRKIVLSPVVVAYDRSVYDHIEDIDVYTTQFTYLLRAALRKIDATKITPQLVYRTVIEVSEET